MYTKIETRFTSIRSRVIYDPREKSLRSFERANSASPPDSETEIECESRTWQFHGR